MIKEQIKSITIENIKGIKKETFNLDIIPNKPSILVAPNGYGKSSFAIAFDSLNSKKINLDKINFHKDIVSNQPMIKICYKHNDGTIKEYIADQTSNLINKEFDIHVINSQLKAKATTKNMGKFSSTISTITVEDILLIDTIPKKILFSYSTGKVRKEFGQNGKIYPNIEDLLRNYKILVAIKEQVDFTKFEGKRIAEELNKIIEEINHLSGNVENIKSIIDTTILTKMCTLAPLKNIVDLISKYDKTLQTETDKYLAAIEIVHIYKKNKNDFNNATKYANYIVEKKELEELFGYLKQTWKDIKPIEDKNKGLLIRFPSAHHISNGERDIITFLASLQRAKRNLKKAKSILIIDEIFDYLDDANLIAAQYHITQLIEAFKIEKKVFYPIILTHLNPDYFKNYCFKNQKIYYLNRKDSNACDSLLKLIQKREEISIKENVSKYLFHYRPESINFREKLRVLSLKETWGEPAIFYDYINAELKKYTDNTPQYDPLAVCCAVRIAIEKKIYNKINDEIKRTEFINTYRTSEKLDFAEKFEIDIPEVFYMLGIIYNSVMHIRKNNADIVTPIVSKLENLTIKHMIKQIEKF